MADQTLKAIRQLGDVLVRVQHQRDEARVALSASQAEVARLRPAAEAMEKLEAWLRAKPSNRFVGDAELCRNEKDWLVSIEGMGKDEAWEAYGPTLPAAILSALAKAEGAT